MHATEPSPPAMQHTLININPIIWSSSCLLSISHYLLTPGTSLFTMPSVQLLAPNESGTCKERQDHRLITLPSPTVFRRLSPCNRCALLGSSGKVSPKFKALACQLLWFRPRTEDVLTHNHPSGAQEQLPSALQAGQGRGALRAQQAGSH